MRRLIKGKYQELTALMRTMRVAEDSVLAMKVVVEMNDKREASKAALLIKDLKYDPAKFEFIKHRLDKGSLRYFLKEKGWRVCEELFCDKMEDLVFREQLEPALHLARKYQLLELGFIQKVECIQLLNKHALTVVAIQEVKDEFSPSNPLALSLAELGFSMEKVHFVSKAHEFGPFETALSSAKKLAFDTEARPGGNTLQSSRPSCLLQVAFADSIFVIDLLNPDLVKLVGKVFLPVFKDPRVVKIGHTVKQDLKEIRRRCQAGQDRPISLIDIAAVHKNLGTGKQSSLRHLCEVYLGKTMDKEETLSNWEIRPLRQRQLHYAALDALAPLLIYGKQEQRFGALVNEVDDQSL